ncbi:MAG: hypothetical protein V1921_04280 [Candidatus Altiarchaeota archaeon]
MRELVSSVLLLSLLTSGCIGVESRNQTTTMSTVSVAPFPLDMSFSTTTSMHELTCFDERRNQDETGVDCGGPCKPCPNCSDLRRNQDELGVDCGSQCEPCDSECFSDSDCGVEHYASPVCSEDQTQVLRHLVNYQCLSPGYPNATCVLLKEPEVVDTCTSAETCIKTYFCPEKSCFEARCVRKEKVCDWIIC